MSAIPHDYSQLASAGARPTRQIDATRPVWIFGAGSFGQSLCQAMRARGISVAGFVETTPKSSRILDLQVVDWATLAEIDRKAQLALGILNRNTPYDELVSIAAKGGFPDVLMPWDTYDALGQDLGWRFWLSKRAFLLSGLDKIAEVSGRLADKESRDNLLRITAFRLGLDLGYASCRSGENQYFNEFSLNPLRGKSITYVDCGAYNGDTYIELLGQPDICCSQSFLLEPDPANFAAMVANVRATKGNGEVFCLPLAAADKYAVLTFSSGQGEGGALGINGDIHIAAVALDEMLPKASVDFIKLDVEGAESQVLKGARSTIERCRPVLAVSLYHNPQDLWALPGVLFEMCEGYDFYIRQHYFNTFDSVFYAVPRQR